MESASVNGRDILVAAMGWHLFLIDLDRLLVH